MKNPFRLADRPVWGGVESLPFWGVHVAALVGVVLLGFSWLGLALAVCFYFLRMFAVTAGYHRYFAHRSFRAGRTVQFLFALFGSTAAQQGPLWWAAHHRRHHKLSDQPGDVHSPRQRGFWWSHVGWIFAVENRETDWARIEDFAEYPELRWLDRHHMVPVLSMAVLCFLIGGSFGLVWAFFVSTTLLWHGTFTINSLAHKIGRPRYQTGDDSKNSLGLALITMGEGWHNNHHYYQRSTSQGFYWWEIDASYYILRLMDRLGLVHGVSGPPRRIRDLRPEPELSVPLPEPLPLKVAAGG